ncbi:MAG: 2,3-cyclic-nucleotide 2-phosphodiesterase [Synergistaceae bacterium]|nr:2,3-cyclic-nucleotide 2-phosphodiesterase [Synergistaceae bacterium]
MKILFIGDIVGRPGRKSVKELLPKIKKEKGPFDFILANGENGAGGFGLTAKVLDEIMGMGLDCLTSGNHIWDKKEFVPRLAEEMSLLRPANYPPSCPGRGALTLEKKGKRLAVLNLQGRIFMSPIDCPFRCADALLEEIDTPFVLVDFHAEATSEKQALGLYLDGRVSVVVGTHTHVQTADERILPGGTAYITDVGMTGGHGGVIGMKPESVLPRFLTGMPSKFETCESHLILSALSVVLDDAGRAVSLERLQYSLSEKP